MSSDSEEKSVSPNQGKTGETVTSTVSPDQGTTGETVTSTVSPDQGTTGDPATPKREGTAEKTNRKPRRKIFYRAEELSRLLKTLNKKD